MISFVRGILNSMEEDAIVVETGGVGLEIRVPLSVLEQLPAIGEEVKIHTYFQVREDGMNLYGFLSRQDKQMFKQLLGVNGIGPKAALGILSTLRPDDLRMAILSEDAKAISKAPGVGAKTAQRIILDLKDKVSMDQLTEHWLSANGAGAGSGAGDADGSSAALTGLAGAAKEAVQALTALGYSNMEASRAVKKVELTEGMTTEDVLKASLKYL
ncbi:MAG: Holliday junction branch migration protein RuvA [Lachnospiraceae bacterium]|nr:Holliday junction branch migration protein RuvA [Lachnospiraceae bacterium]